MELATTPVLEIVFLVQIRQAVSLARKGSYLQMELAEDVLCLALTAVLQTLPSALHVLLDFHW